MRSSRHSRKQRHKLPLMPLRKKPVTSTLPPRCTYQWNNRKIAGHKYFDGDLPVLRKIQRREGVLDLLHRTHRGDSRVLAAAAARVSAESGSTGHAGAKQAIDAAKPPVPMLRYARILHSLNRASADVIEAVHVWEEGQTKADAQFRWEGVNYLLRVPIDLQFLNGDTALKEHFGLPDLSHLCFAMRDSAGSGRAGRGGAVRDELCSREDRARFERCTRLVVIAERRYGRLFVDARGELKQPGAGARGAKGGSTGSSTGGGASRPRPASAAARLGRSRRTQQRQRRPKTANGGMAGGGGAAPRDGVEPGTRLRWRSMTTGADLHASWLLNGCPSKRPWQRDEEAEARAAAAAARQQGDWFGRLRRQLTDSIPRGPGQLRTWMASPALLDLEGREQTARAHARLERVTQLAVATLDIAAEASDNEAESGANEGTTNGAGGAPTSEGYLLCEAAGCTELHMNFTGPARFFCCGAHARAQDDAWRGALKRHGGDEAASSGGSWADVDFGRIDAEWAIESGTIVPSAASGAAATGLVDSGNGGQNGRGRGGGDGAPLRCSLEHVPTLEALQRLRRAQKTAYERCWQEHYARHYKDIRRLWPSPLPRQPRSRAASRASTSSRATSRDGSGSQSQSRGGAAPPLQPAQYRDAGSLTAVAIRMLEPLFTIARLVAMNADGFSVSWSLKRPRRLWSKVYAKYDRFVRDCGRVLDPARTSVVFDSTEGILKALVYLQRHEQQLQLRVVRVKDFLSAARADGYRHVLVNVALEMDELAGAVGEISLELRELRCLSQAKPHLVGWCRLLRCFECAAHVGAVVAGQAEGPGACLLASGERYIGAFKRGQRHGIGVSYSHSFADGGAARFEGLWSKGSRLCGVLNEAGGATRYEGMFDSDLPHGYGVAVGTLGVRLDGGNSSNNGAPWQSFRYEGAWASGDRHGAGMLYRLGTPPSGAGGRTSQRDAGGEPSLWVSGRRVEVPRVKQRALAQEAASAAERAREVCIKASARAHDARQNERNAPPVPCITDSHPTTTSCNDQGRNVPVQDAAAYVVDSGTI